MCRRSAGFAALLLLVLAGVATWRFGAASALALALAAPATEPWLAALRDPPRREEIAIPSDAGGLEADLYRPGRARGSLLLVHGLSQAGRRQPDLERLARLLAGQGLVVVVPQFAGLAAFRLTGREVEDVRSALRHAAALGRQVAGSPAGGSVGIAGFSFGAGPALIAAADVPDLRVAASFGGYADLLDVITYVTTGAHTFEGRRHVRRQEEYNRWKLLALLAPLVTAEGRPAMLDDIARRKLADPGANTLELEQALDPAGRAVLALVVNRREDRVAVLVAGLPVEAREALGRLSPLAAIPRIRGRLLVAHGVADNSIPFTESLRLAAAAGGRARLALFETFHHTGPQPFWPSAVSRAGDAWKLLRVADELAGR